MPSQERIVEVVVHKSTINNHFFSQSGIWQLQIKVLFHAFMESRSIESRALTCIDSILVRSPHVLDPFVVVSELARITKPGGSMIISVPNYGYLKYIVCLFLGRQPVTGGAGALESWRHGGWDGWHLHTFTLQSVRHLAENSGWTVQKITGYGEKFDIFPISYLRRNVPHLFSGALTLMCRKK